MPLGAEGTADAARHSKGQKLKLGWQQRVPLVDRRTVPSVRVGWLARF